MDRIYMLVAAPPADKTLLRGSRISEQIRTRVVRARNKQLARQDKTNNVLQHKEIEVYCPLSDSDYQLVEKAITRLSLSARAYHRILKVARTIADLAGSRDIRTEHLSEAIGYRRMDLTGL